MQNEDETITLTPFTVSTTEDNGYTATETIAGTRFQVGEAAGRFNPVSWELLWNGIPGLPISDRCEQAPGRPDLPPTSHSVA